MGRGEGGAEGGVREEDLTAKLGNLDYALKEKESITEGLETREG